MARRRGPPLGIGARRLVGTLKNLRPFHPRRPHPPAGVFARERRMQIKSPVARRLPREYLGLRRLPITTRLRCILLLRGTCRAVDP